MNRFRLEDYAIYIRPGITDMRKRSVTLSMMIATDMKQDPYSKSVFMFCGKTRKILKAVVWDRNGFWEMTKRLEQGTFPWPGTQEEALNITVSDVRLMLDGVNVFKRLPELKYEFLV